jgi:hypothetical protein
MCAAEEKARQPKGKGRRQNKVDEVQLVAHRVQLLPAGHPEDAVGPADTVLSRIKT